MANIGTLIINQNFYVNIAEVFSFDFTEDTTYTIQLSTPAYVREGVNGRGFKIDTNKPFEFTYKGEALYIKPIQGATEVNLAE